MKIKKVEQKVLKVLEERPETRSDDFILIYYVYKEYLDISVFRFSSVMLHHNDLELPSFHSITRARRKIFEKFPELKPKKVTKFRAEKEEEFKEYARQGWKN